MAFPTTFWKRCSTLIGLLLRSRWFVAFWAPEIRAGLILTSYEVCNQVLMNFPAFSRCPVGFFPGKVVFYFALHCPNVFRTTSARIAQSPFPALFLGIPENYIKAPGLLKRFPLFPFCAPIQNIASPRAIPQKSSSFSFYAHRLALSFVGASPLSKSFWFCSNFVVFSLFTPPSESPFIRPALVPHFSPPFDLQPSPFGTFGRVGSFD